MAAAAAAWLRIDELNNSSAELVCLVARVQSINSSQRILVVHDEKDISLNVSLNNLMTMLSPGQYVQVYGKLQRKGDQVMRIDAQFIRSLGVDFDMDKYVQGLILTRKYLNDVDGDNVIDKRIVETCRQMEWLKRRYHRHFDCVVLI